MKSLASFVGTATNITYRNFKLMKSKTSGMSVKTAVMVNMYNQGSSCGSTSSPTRLLNTSLPSTHDVLIQNVTGEAVAAGTICCGAGVSACHDIRMEGVSLSPVKPGDNFRYTCQNAVGTEAACSPVPCGWGKSCSTCTEDE
jgi:hypothetical protein